MKKRIFTFLALISTGILILSQENNSFKSMDGQLNLANPDLRQFEQVKHYNVNEFSGQPDVKIPLFEIKSGDITIPINITYNTKGVKVNQKASKVGLGWSISEIFIGRQINDGQDMDDARTFDINRVGYFKKRKEDTKFLLTETEEPSTLLNIDFLPDTYTAYLPASQNLFYFDNEQKFHLLTENDIRVSTQKETHNEVSHSPTTDFFNIDILDNNGIKYSFNDYEMALYNNYEGSDNYESTRITHVPYVSSWKVSSISDLKNNSKINFEYESVNDYLDGTIFYSRDIHSAYYSKFFQKNGRVNNGYYANILYPDLTAGEKLGLTLRGFADNITGPSEVYNNHEPEYRYEYVHSVAYYEKQKQLKKINFKEGYVVFEYNQNRLDVNNGEKALSSIKLYDYNNILIKHFNFQYGYFGNVTNSINGSGELRLKLNQIEEVGKGFYKFKYNEDMAMPNYLSRGYDYGGYFNGDTKIYQKNDTPKDYYYYPNQKEWSILPFSISDSKLEEKGIYKFCLTCNDGTISKVPDEEFSKLGILKEIEYPTKGSLKLEYELNDFIILGDSQKAPGLRIKRMILNNGDSDEQEINYKYTDYNGISSGRMATPPYIGYPKAQLFKAYIESAQGYEGMLVTDFNGLPNFYTDQLYKLFKIYDKPSDIVINYGQVEKITSTTGKTVTQYTTYDDFPQKRPFISGNLGPQVNKPNLLHNSSTFGDFLGLNSAYSYTSKYFWNPTIYGDPKKIEIYNEQGNKIKETIFDYEVLDYYPQDMSANTTLFKPIFNITKNPHWSSPDHFPPYFFNSIGTIYSQYLYKSRKLKQIKDLIIPTSGTPNETTTAYYFQDNHARNLEYKYQIFKNGLKKGISYIYDNPDRTTYEQKSILHLENIPVGYFTFNSDMNSQEDFILGQNKIKQDFYKINQNTSNLFLKSSSTFNVRFPDKIIGEPKILATYNLYDSNANILEYTNSSNRNTTIIYGYNQLYPIAQIEGATYPQIMQAFSLSGNDPNSYLNLDIVKISNLDKDKTSENTLISALDQFRTKSEFKNFQITTYTYDPLVGVTSVTPPDGIRQYYCYDINNKLKSIRDSNGNIIEEYEYKYKNN